MALGGCYTCLRYLMFIFNFIFWIIGCGLMAMGIWAKLDEESLADVVEHEEFAYYVSLFAWVIIVIGAIIMVLGFLGCCGAVKENQCMLATFFILLFIIFAALVVIGVFAYLKFTPTEELLREQVEKILLKKVEDYKTDNKSMIFLNDLHREFNCCGSYNRTDFVTLHSEEVAMKACGAKDANLPGCASHSLEKTEEVLNEWLIIFVAVAFGVAVIMLLGMIFALLLCCAIRETTG